MTDRNVPLRQPRTPSVPPEDPWANDRLGRKAFGESLAKLVEKLPGPYVLALDAPWGSGKTTFCRMWADHMTHPARRADVIYYSAWESDFTGDALTSVLGELTIGLRDAIPSTKDAVERMVSAAAPLLKRGLFGTLRIAGRTATMGLLDTDEFVGTEAGTFAADIGSQLIAQFKRDRNAMTGFRDALVAVVKQRNAEPGKHPGPLVIVIDELDRCRPTFAIEVLEVIKHLFNVEGVVFVLALDRTQLAHAVRAVYGAGCDADGYLRRFFNLEMALPPASRVAFVEGLLGDAGCNVQPINKGHTYRGISIQDCARLICTVADARELSLRDVEAVVTIIALLGGLPTSDAPGYGYMRTLVALAAVLECGMLREIVAESPYVGETFLIRLLTGQYDPNEEFALLMRRVTGDVDSTNGVPWTMLKDWCSIAFGDFSNLTSESKDLVRYVQRDVRGVLYGGLRDAAIGVRR